MLETNFGFFTVSVTSSGSLDLSVFTMMKFDIDFGSDNTLVSSLDLVELEYFMTHFNNQKILNVAFNQEDRRRFHI